MGATVTQQNALDMQVCVPEDWTDEQIKQFADQENPSGLEAGWQIRKAGDEALAGLPERIRCRDRQGYVHVMLDA